MGIKFLVFTSRIKLFELKPSLPLIFQIKVHFSEIHISYLTILQSKLNGFIGPTKQHTI